VITLSESGYYRIELAESGVEVLIRGAWHAQQNNEVLIQLDIVHQAPRTRSETLLRGVVEDSAKISLTGTIIVEEAAQDTNAFLTENILLLSDQAQAEAIPNLEIHANQVKCSHAATITNINQEHLFYFAARGISAATATRLIIDGFLAAATTKNSPTSQAERPL